jgi:hypothetical protein
MKRWMTATDFAKIIEKDPKTVILWIKSGWIPSAKKVGRLYRIPRGEISIYQDADEYPLQKWRKQ